MNYSKLRKKIANFLATVKAESLPLSARKDATTSFVIYDKNGASLYRENWDIEGKKPISLTEQLQHLRDIIRTINEEGLAVADKTLQANAAEAGAFRTIIQQVWVNKGKNDFIARASVLTQAAKTGLPEELTIALFGRLIKAGFIHLHRITSGANYYDRRFYRDPGRLRQFLAMGNNALLRALAPSPISIPPAPVLMPPPPIFSGGKLLKSERAADTGGVPLSDWPIVQDSPPRRGSIAATPELVAFARAADKQIAAGLNKNMRREVDEESAKPLVPSTENKLHLAHVVGTQKHDAIDKKLRAELSPIFLMHSELYECKKLIKFSKKDGDFNNKELRAINDIMKELRGADYILVEYSIPMTESMPKGKRRIDLAVFYKRQGLLKIIDWKFGLGPVPIDNNEQLQAYADCLLEYVFPPANVSVIEKVIVQPNNTESTKRTLAYRDVY